MMISMGYASLLHRIRRYDLFLATSLSTSLEYKSGPRSPGYQAVDGTFSGRRSPSPTLSLGRDMGSLYVKASYLPSSLDPSETGPKGGGS